LLLQDLCGADKCSFIGYPPKLIASALAKYANEEEPTSNIWDQAQSVATAFAVNISLHIIDQINSTKIRKIIFRTNQFYHRKFLYIIQVIKLLFIVIRWSSLRHLVCGYVFEILDLKTSAFAELPKMMI
jgi:phosphatidylserine synthase